MVEKLYIYSIYKFICIFRLLFASSNASSLCKANWRMSFQASLVVSMFSITDLICRFVVDVICNKKKEEKEWGIILCL